MNAGGVGIVLMIAIVSNVLQGSAAQSEYCVYGLTVEKYLHP